MKPVAKTNLVHQQLLAGLIETTEFSTTYKKWDEENKDVVTEKVKRLGLRSPLAQNISEENVERAAKRWIK